MSSSEMTKKMDLDGVYSEVWNIEAVHCFLDATIGYLPQGSGEPLELSSEAREGFQVIMKDLRRRTETVLESLGGLMNADPDDTPTDLTPLEKRRKDLHDEVYQRLFGHAEWLVGMEVEHLLKEEGLITEGEDS